MHVISKYTVLNYNWPFYTAEHYIEKLKQTIIKSGGYWGDCFLLRLINTSIVKM